MSSRENVTNLIESFRTCPSPNWGVLEVSIYERIKRSAFRVIGHSDASVSFGATSLTHETFIKLAKSSCLASIRDVEHFFALFTVMLRQTFLDHNRRRSTLKSGGKTTHVPLDYAIHQLESSTGAGYSQIDDCMSRLAEQYPRKAQVLTMRAHMGFEVQEIAETLGVSKSTAEKDLAFARAFMRLALDET